MQKALPYMAMALDVIALWACATDNDFISLDNLRLQIIHLTGHLLDVRVYDWIFDCLQSMPDKYSEPSLEAFTHKVSDFIHHIYFFFKGFDIVILQIGSFFDYLHATISPTDFLMSNLPGNFIAIARTEVAIFEWLSTIPRT
ncbi:MAG: hypothetical protein SFU99_16325 [Saprospiraceae bacterium]|nr:hypothetical protein [Saprospiraceae bacterium]